METPKPKDSLPVPSKRAGWDITPRTLEEATKFAKMIADSDLAPKDYKGKPGNVLIACQMGAELGLKPIQAIQNIAVINGRPTVWGDAIVGLVQGSGKLEAFKETFDDKTMNATCNVKRHGKDWTTVTFSQKDAEKAGLWRKQGPWQQYPKRMLQLRARAFAMRDAFADVLKGLQVREEIEDIRYTAIDASTVPEPKPTPQPAAAPEPKATPAAAPSPATKPELGITRAFVTKVTATTKDEKEWFWIYDKDGTRIGSRSKAVAEACKQAKKDNREVELGLNRSGEIVEAKVLARA